LCRTRSPRWQHTHHLIYGDQNRSRTYCCHLPGKLNQGKFFTEKREKMKVIFKKRIKLDALDLSQKEKQTAAARHFALRYLNV